MADATISRIILLKIERETPFNLKVSSSNARGLLQLD